MGRQRAYRPRGQRRNLSPEALMIEQILRKEKIDLSSGSTTTGTVRPATKRALVEMAACSTLSDVYDMAQRNVEYHEKLINRDIELRLRKYSARAAALD